MDKDFVRDIDFITQESNQQSFIYVHTKLLEFIHKYKFILSLYFDNVLDVGERNPLTERLEIEFDININSTSGDLDKELICPKKQYDLVIFSHVIEHLFNPLFCLENIKKVMKRNGVLIIACPIKPNFLTWGHGHFHEMNNYGFKKLLNRAGFEIIVWEKFHNLRSWKSFMGIRPILRQFFRSQTMTICRKQTNPYSTQARTRALEMEEKFKNQQ